jgi:hypothetical protein
VQIPEAAADREPVGPVREHHVKDDGVIGIALGVADGVATVVDDGDGDAGLSQAPAKGFRRLPVVFDHKDLRAVIIASV